MRPKFLLILLLPSLVLTGCLSKKDSQRSEADLRSTSTSTKTQTPVALDDFDDIHPNQIGDTINVNGDEYALVLQPNINTPLNLPEDFALEFVGVLKKSGDDKWVKIAKVEDILNQTSEDSPLPKNNPLAIWDEKGALRLAVVDQNGAGSGEGFFKVFHFKDARIWVQESCGYYRPEDGDFLDFDRRLDFEYFQFNSIDRSYQSGPVFDKASGDEFMINEPSCENAFVSVIR